MEAGYCPHPHQIEIYITDDRDNENVSVAEIVKAEYFSNEDTPIQKGLVDPRLGAITNKYFCHTCKNNSTTCPGHFGHYSICTPVRAQWVLWLGRKVLQRWY